MVPDRRTFLGALAAAALLPHRANAQGQPLRIVVPFSAGSGTDITARMLADTITRTTGRPVVVDNRSGAGGALGAMEVARARPDGNTVLYTSGGFTTNAVLIKKLPFDAIADFTPITMLSRSSGFALLVRDKSPYRSIEEFIAAAKAQPGQLSFGSSGIGNTTHVMGVLFCKGVGIDLLHVPFKGTPNNDLIAGTVDSAFLSPSVAAQQIRAGQLRALGISGVARSSMLPDTRTFTELGLKVQDIPGWSGVWGPARMEPDMVHALHELLTKATATPEMLKYTRDNGGEPAHMPPDAFKAYVAGEIERYRKLLPPLGIEIG
ncbi:Bug family tripartite tricarboxylate transporter substrate binding protein [Pseudorhodoferax sp.]|uniref:Bug family tripartite tricarboxylate transporter substrate binding protein n=1 Tax=Pseudorhodoferax sp. TaxID=1993553 RepID=UPI002DD6475B|nr:tripartite tricarboxylate transporter substrate binding protein [Pseudorhodoferax sp.]